MGREREERRKKREEIKEKALNICISTNPKSLTIECSEVVLCPECALSCPSADSVLPMIPLAEWFMWSE